MGVAIASADDCADCTAVVSTLGVYLTSDESISAQVDILLSEVCPTAPNPEECVEGLPAFWTRVAMVLWEGYYNPSAEWMCATEDICGAPAKSKLAKSLRNSSQLLFQPSLLDLTLNKQWVSVMR